MSQESLSLMSLTFVLVLVAGAGAGPEPVAHYQFDGANDFSNTGTDATAITGEPKGDAQIIWDDARGSYVLSVDGDGDYVYFDRSWQGIVDREITVAAWIKTSSLGSSAAIASLGYAWRLRGGAGGNVAFQVMNTTPVSAATGTIPVDDGVWHHVAGAYDGSEYKLYIDGRTNVSVASSGVLQGGATAYYGTIGAHYKRSDGAPKFFFNGLIDDVRVYDRVLSEEEILEITGLSGVKAAAPNPTDGQQLDVVEGVVLSWEPGVEADQHDVYFGASLDDVSAADTTTDAGGVYKGRQDPNQYAVDMILDFGATYYWRIDEVGGPPDFTTHKGNVWRFIAEPIGYRIPGSAITATASSSLLASMGPERTIDGSGLDGDLHSTDMEDMWLSDAQGPQPTWIEFEFDKVYKLHEMWVWNQNQVVESTIGYGFREVLIEYSVDGVSYATLGTTHEFTRAPGTPNYAHNTAVDLSGATARYVRLTANSNWGGLLTQYGLSEVRFFYIPVRAREPRPADGTEGAGPDLVLGWRAGREAATHDVYLSSDREAVLGGTAYVGSVTETGYDAGALDLSQTYYWRVDEADETQTPALEGELWSFTTPDYLIVDDFESYDDADHRLYEIWVDGAVNGSGSYVGYEVAENGTFGETTIVHGGGQSMPLFYDNSFNYSEAERMLSPPRDWTESGIGTLSVNFCGDPDNAVEQMYVKVNGSKVVYDGEPADITQPSWTRWNIDLASFGVDLANVTTLAVGLGDETNLVAGGSGVVYVDDIRLYRLVPEPPLEIWFEAEAADSITAPMQIYDDPQASGGQYIGTPADSGDETENPPVYGVAAYRFTVPEGTYKVLLHVIVIGGADSFWVRIPGAVCDPGTHRDTDWIRFNVIDKGDVWHWDEVHSNDHGNQVVEFTLSAGEHTLEIARRDAGTLLDCILITDELDLDQRSLPHAVP